MALAPSGAPRNPCHDFLWRINRALPQRGAIGIFNRSHYEEVLAVRVHPEFLARQHLPKQLQGKKLWDERLEAITDFERFLMPRQGLVVLKFFLNVSKEEQRRRFLDRLEQREKHWKFSPSDMAERAYWDDYQAAYQAAIAATATPHAPWFVVPADHKWYTRLIVVGAMIEALEAPGPEGARADADHDQPRVPLVVRGDDEPGGVRRPRRTTSGTRGTIVVSVGSGTFRSSASSASIIAPTTISRVYHLWSAGTTGPSRVAAMRPGKRPGDNPGVGALQAMSL